MVSNDLPPFTVLLSVYKSEKPQYLDQALQSIKDQSVIPNEILIIEDGKLPQTLLTILDKHELNTSISFVRIKLRTNQGLGNALSIGVKKAKNNLIARMDTDDISVKDRFEAQLAEFQIDDSLVLVGGQIDEFNNNPQNIISHKWVPSKEKEIENFIKYRNPFNHPTVMFKKNIILKVGNYIEIKGFEDYFLWSRIIANKYKTANLDKVLVHMRVGDGMYSRRGGISYFYRYILLRCKLRKLSIVNTMEMVSGDLLMLMNIILPTKIRKFVYKNFLRK